MVAGRAVCARLGRASGDTMQKILFYAGLLLIALSGFNVVQAQNAQVVIDAYPNTATPAQGSTLILVCRVVGVPSTPAVSYEWTCPDSCDAGAVDPEWAARIQQGNILVVNIRNGTDGGAYTCSVNDDTQQVGTATHQITSVTNGVSVLNEAGNFQVFFPKNSFVTNTTLTSTNEPRQQGSGSPGNDHFVCIIIPIQSTVAWYRNDTQLVNCATPCMDCGGRCQGNGAVGVDPPTNGQHNIHIYTGRTQYINQDLECRPGQSGQSAFIGVYLMNGVDEDLQPPSSITQGTTSANEMSVSWSQVSGATGYYVSYQRQDLGSPPVVTPQYERNVGGKTDNSVTLSDLAPGTTYKIRVWSRGTSNSMSVVSSMSTEMDVATNESSPSAPRMLTIVGVATESAVELNWLPPLNTNGDIYYKIEYEGAMSPTVNPGNSSSLYFTLTLPNELLTYNVRVVAVNTQGLGEAQSDVLPVCLGKSREEVQLPTGLTVTANECDSAMVTWNPAQSRLCDVTIVEYSVRYQPSGGGGSILMVKSVNTNIMLEGLLPNTEYNVSVAAILSNGSMTAYSPAAQLSITDPTSPSMVSAVVTGCDTAMVTWTASMSMFDDTVGNYNVRYRLSSSGGAYTTSSSSTTSTTLQGLTPNEQYDVSVAGINSCGGTSAFTTDQFESQDPTSPSLLQVDVTGCNTAMVSWMPSMSSFNPSTVGNYSVRYRLSNSSGAYTTVYSPMTNVMLQDLTPNEGYTVEVAGINSCGGISAFMMGSFELKDPVPPTGVMAVAGTECGTAAVSWMPPNVVYSPFVGTYSVRYRVSGSTDAYSTEDATTTSVTLRGLDAIYTIEVAASDSCGRMSGFSTMMTVVDLRDPAPPANVTVVVTGCDSATVSWMPSTSKFNPTIIVDYDVRYRLSSSSSGPYTMSSLSDTSTTLQGLTPNEQYDVSVQGVNSCDGRSDYVTVQFQLQDLDPPTDVTAVTGTDCGTADVSWMPPNVVYSAFIGNYSVRYRVSSTIGAYTTEDATTTSVTLPDISSAMYAIEVAAIDSCGGMSGFSTVFSVDLRDPTPPEGVTVTLTGCNTAMVSWMPSMSSFNPSTVGNYSIRYRLSSSSGAYTTVYSPMTNVMLQDLTPNEGYTVEVAGINSCGGISAFMMGSFILKDPDTPTGVTAVAGSECGTVDVSWAPANVPYVPAIADYRLRYEVSGSPGNYSTVNTTTTNVTLQGLDASLEYTVEVDAFDLCGRGSGYSNPAMLNLQAPDPPTSVSVEDGTECYTSTVSWVTLPSMCDVVIGNYSVRYRLENGSSVYTTVFTSAKSVTLQDIMANTEYTVSVAAISANGEAGAFTVAAQFELQEPKPPTGVTFTITAIDTAEVSWMASQSVCDDVIGNYSVQYWLRNGTGNITTVYTTATSITLSGLIPNAEYSVSVAASNSMGDVSAVSVEVPFTVSTTAPATAPQSQLVTIIAIVVVAILAVVVAGILVAVCCGVFCWRRKRKDKLYAPSVSATKTTFQPKGTIQYDNMYAEVRETNGQPEKPPIDFSSGAPSVSEYDYAVVPKGMMGPAAGAEVAVDQPGMDHQYAAVAKKDKNGVGAEDTAVNPESSSPHLQPKLHPKPPPRKPAPFGGKDDRSIVNDGAFDDYLKQVESMHSQGKASFEAEYNSVEKRSASSTAIAESNNAKNRYKNIFAYDSSRVVLTVPNTSGTDYINASYIDGYRAKDAYIASQAPAPGTVDDFWQMIWDQKLNMVIMLTKTMEGTKRKSEDYYPEGPGDTFSSGRFQIRTISLKYHVEYEVRVFEVAQVSDPSRTRTLDHYLFTGWPDYGVPKYPTSLIRMLYHVRDARVSDVPIMVHCSAGVGRTGTFIALDITLDQMRAEKKVDVKGTMEKMREKRMNMIQTVDQYMFVYDAVRELLLLGDTTIKASDMRMAMSQLKKKDAGSTGYQQQFASLNILTQESADDERVEEDTEIIRYLDRSPIKGKHLFVSKPMAGGPVVINASFVDGYHAPRAFIAAQSPMRATVDEFWSLIAEKKVQTVLLLCQLMEDSQETCHMFWPHLEGGTLEVGTMKVVMQKSTASSEFDTFQFTIQKPRSTQDVTLLHYKQWPENMRPKSASFLKLLASAQKLQQPHSTKPIVVACNDGLGRTGTFIAIWSLIEQMKAEGQIDAVGTVKSIRTQRPGAVPHMDQFVYCHDLLLEYVDSFEGYSNFNI